MRSLELVRLIVTLRHKGWTDTEILDFILELKQAVKE